MPLHWSNVAYALGHLWQPRCAFIKRKKRTPPALPPKDCALGSDLHSIRMKQPAACAQPVQCSIALQQRTCSKCVLNTRAVTSSVRHRAPLYAEVIRLWLSSGCCIFKSRRQASIQSCTADSCSHVVPHRTCRKALSPARARSAGSTVSTVHLQSPTSCQATHLLLCCSLVHTAAVVSLQQMQSWEHANAVHIIQLQSATACQLPGRAPAACAAALSTFSARRSFSSSICLMRVRSCGRSLHQPRDTSISHLLRI